MAFYFILKEKGVIQVWRYLRLLIDELKQRNDFDGRIGFKMGNIDSVISYLKYISQKLQGLFFPVYPFL